MLGMTETSCISFMTPYQWRLIDDFSSIGTIGPHASAKVIDESGATVAPGVAGELCISGYLIHKGYFANREKSEEILSRDETGAEWLHTGDTVTLDKAGYCRFAGRQKDLIKRGKRMPSVFHRLSVSPFFSYISRLSTIC